MLDSRDTSARDATTFKNQIIIIYRCGVYCAANACIEQVIQHGEVRVNIV